MSRTTVHIRFTQRLISVTHNIRIRHAATDIKSKRGSKHHEGRRICDSPHVKL
jgi:hypothetical protein